MSEVTPSQTAVMTEDELGEALRRLREQARQANTEQLANIHALRADIHRRLDIFIGLDMASIDRNPQVQGVVGRLATLTIQLSSAVKEMRTVASAIRQATRVIALADEAIGLLG
jgi:hypothetical protein